MITETHAHHLRDALAQLLGTPSPGDVVFLRCLTSTMIDILVDCAAFHVPGWQVFAVLDRSGHRRITADQAVELREDKDGAILLLIDPYRAGAGLDGVYSAAREINESALFTKAMDMARGGDRLSQRRFFEAAIRKAARVGRRSILSPFQKFDFLVEAGNPDIGPGRALGRLGLWPVEAEGVPGMGALDMSGEMINRLLYAREDSRTPATRVAALLLDDPDGRQSAELEGFLRETAHLNARDAVSALAHHPDLALGRLSPQFAGQSLKAMDWVPWRSSRGRYAKWSGLILDEGEDKPRFTIDREASKKDAAKLEVRWTTDPDSLGKGAVVYQVTIMADIEELAELEIPHSGRQPQKAVFRVEDFENLDDNARFEASVRISAVASDAKPINTEEFILEFGKTQEKAASTSGRGVRTFVEGLIAIGDRDAFDETIKSPRREAEDKKGFLTWRLPDGKSVRVLRPALIAEAEVSWQEQGGSIGRWIVSVRADGSQAGPIEFVPIPQGACPEATWTQVTRAAQKLCAELGPTGLLGRVQNPDWKSAKTYRHAWTEALENGDPALALHGTVEVRSMGGRTLGLIVLPLHPLRFTWHAAYDTLAAQARYDQGLSPGAVVKALSALNSAQFPAFLPGLSPGESFVFGDVLGFHAVAMTRDDDREPKAAVALMATCLGGERRRTDSPTVGEQSAAVLGREIRHYLDCHRTEEVGRLSLLNIHALRPGDGMTVARALRAVIKPVRQEDDSEDDDTESPLCFTLDLFPSKDQEAVAGRFLTDIARRRRSGGEANDDRWMTETAARPGNIMVPRLRWARRKQNDNEAAPAHIALAFDLFASRVEIRSADALPGSKRPLHAYGLSAQIERHAALDGEPTWTLFPPVAYDGDKLPGSGTLTDRLVRLQKATLQAVARHLGGDPGSWPVLVTRLPTESRENIDDLHLRSDWVVTLDRNACLEYFDSPLALPTVYERYVIDAVPERADLGALQLVTSTSNIEEVRNLLDETLTEMGLPGSARNCRALLAHVKGLSGRLAIRLANAGARTGEIAALALVSASSRAQNADLSVWQPLSEGFFIPVDEIVDLVPLQGKQDEPDNRSDLIFVRAPRRGPLEFRFIQVKFRRHLRMARQSDLHASMLAEAADLRERWNEHFFGDRLKPLERTLRRSQLARLLAFYADKAARHHLEPEVHQRLRKEIDNLLRGDSNPSAETSDHAYIFCPDLGETTPDVTASPDGAMRVCIFGPTLLLADAPEPGGLSGQERSADEPESNAEETASDNTAEAGRGRGAVETDVRLGTVIGGSDDVSWRVSIRANPHLLMVGLPGMGKTTSLINICRRLYESGIAPIVFSYHEDIDAKLAEIFGRVDTIDCQGLGFNPLRIDPRPDGTIPPGAHIDVAGELRDIFSAIFPDLGDIQTDLIRVAVKTSYTDLGWGTNSPEPRPIPSFRAFFDALSAPEPKVKSVSGLLSRLTELADYGFFDASGDQGSLLDSSAPTIVRVHATSNELLQRAFASFVFYSLYKDMFKRGVQKRLTHAIVFDEAHRAAKLKLIPTMAKECRKYGLALILASQEAKDFNDSLYSAVGNYLALRLTETDARTLARKVVASTEERRVTDRLKALDKYTALFFPAEGRSRATPIRLLQG